MKLGFIFALAAAVIVTVVGAFFAMVLHVGSPRQVGEATGGALYPIAGVAFAAGVLIEQRRKR